MEVAVIGAGFGGLACALELLARGRRVVVCETLGYPGGCAGTFARDGYRFEAGATLPTGLLPGQLFGDWIRSHGLPVAVQWLDPVLELRTPALRLPVARSRDAFVATMLALPGAPVAQLRAFFAAQGRVAAALWPILEQPGRLPPWSATALGWHARHGLRSLRALRWAGRPLATVLRHYGVHGFAPLRLWADALCQITLQTGAENAEAPWALAVLDFPFRGTAHVRGGIGALAQALADAVVARGGAVHLGTQVRGLRPAGAGWQLELRDRTLAADRVVANLLPQDLARLLGTPAPASLARRAAPLAAGWGAVLLYRVVRAPAAVATSAAHLQLVVDPTAPLREGNHVFVSIGSADDPEVPPGLRVLTASTHVLMRDLLALDPAARAARVAAIQARMRQTLAELAPEWSTQVVHELTASPRTFQRFTGRQDGLVGGVPRRLGLGSYLGAWPRPVARGLWLVGDSGFPGQGILAVAAGGSQVARALR